MSNLAQDVAKLARIEVPDDQAESTQAELEKVLDYVKQLDSVELPENTEPFFGAIESVNAIRADEVRPSQTREAILANSPDTDGEFYRVPPVFKS